MMLGNLCASQESSNYSMLKNAILIYENQKTDWHRLALGSRFSDLIADNEREQALEARNHGFWGCLFDREKGC